MNRYFFHYSVVMERVILLKLWKVWKTDHVSDQSSRQRRRKIIWKLRRFCPAMTWKSTVSAAVSPTSNQILMLNTRVFYATWLRTTSIGSGESHGVLWPGIMLRQLDRWDEAWYHVKDHLNYSTFKHPFFTEVAQQISELHTYETYFFWNYQF